MQTKVGYNLDFVETVCSNCAKYSKSLEVCLGLALDEKFGGRLGLEFKFALGQRIRFDTVPMGWYLGSV